MCPEVEIDGERRGTPTEKELKEEIHKLLKISVSLGSRRTNGGRLTLPAAARHRRRQWTVVRERGTFAGFRPASSDQVRYLRHEPNPRLSLQMSCLSRLFVSFRDLATLQLTA